MEKQKLAKRKEHAFGSDIYLIGIKDGIYYWLEEPKWACDWYWSFGHILTFTNNKSPQIAHDINTSEHFDRMFIDYKTCCMDNMKAFFDETVFSDRELYVFCELMLSFYTCKKFAELTFRGGSHITTNPCQAVLQNKNISNTVNNKFLPEIFNEIRKIIEP